MRLLRWMTVLWLGWGCAAEVDDVPRATQRQAFSSPPITLGLDGGLLGFSLAPCSSGFLAGAPGNGSAYNTRTDAGFATGAEFSLGRAVACSGSGPTAQMFTAGTGGAKQLLGGLTTTLTSQASVALALAPSASLPLLVGQAGGTVRFFSTTGLIEVATPLSGTSSSFGASLAWYPGGTRFAVGSPDGGEVAVYDYAGASSVRQWVVTSGHAQFGRALAVGDVSPRVGTELIVGSEGVVFIYDEGGALIQTLTGGASFGASLAVEKDWAPGLDALWVGEPAGDRIYTFIGDAGTPDDYLTMGNRFGESLAIDQGATLAIGAPGYPNGQQRGAVFSKQLTSGAVRYGEVGDCSANADCPAPNCMHGTCVGGVFCTGLSTTCSGNEHCDVGTGVDRCLLPDGGVAFDAGMQDGGAFDAGPFDAGPFDAGPFDAGPFDAGPFDAGPFDAGYFDGGLSDGGDFDGGLFDGGLFDGGLADGGSEPTTTVVFHTSGCSSGPSLPLSLLCLALIRARRQR